MPSPSYVSRPLTGAGEPLSDAQAAGRNGAVDAAATVLDVDALARLAELDPKGESQLLQRVMKTFVTSAARLLAQLETGRATGDRAAIRLVAHTLKSSAGYIGALQLAQCCVRLEAAATKAEFAEVEEQIGAMSKALAGALDAVSRRLDVR